MSLMELNLDIDKDGLEKIINDNIKNFKEYFEWVPIEVKEDRAWKQFKVDPYKFDCVKNIFTKIEHIFKDEKIDCFFYILEKHNSIGTHTDPNTLSAINILISDDNAPIIIEDNHYVYNTALVDTSKMHSVPASETDRLLLKFSLRDIPFDIAKEKLCLLKK